MREKLLLVVWVFLATFALADRREHFVERALAEDFTASLKSGKPTAGIVGTGDNSDQQAAAAFRTGLSGADTLTTAGILATTEFTLDGRQIVKVTPQFSASGANCKVRLAYIYKIDRSVGSSATSTTNNRIIGLSDERTVTAGTVQYEGSYYPTTTGDEFFDGAGAVTIRILITQATSAGTVAFRVGSK